MKNKGSLVLMEQLLMVLVFAIAAAFCLQAFALSQKISRQFTQTDRASAAAQSAADAEKYMFTDVYLPDLTLNPGANDIKLTFVSPANLAIDRLDLTTKYEGKFYESMSDYISDVCSFYIFLIRRTRQCIFILTLIKFFILSIIRLRYGIYKSVEIWLSIWSIIIS